MASLTTFIGVAQPWMSDQMGHVNVRHLIGMFDDGNLQLLAALASPMEGLGWADVHMDIDYMSETRAGDALTITGWIEKLGARSLTSVQSLCGTVDGRERARMRTVTVRFDLVARRAVDLDRDLRERAEALQIKVEN